MVPADFISHATKCAVARFGSNLGFGRAFGMKILVVEDEPLIRLGLVSTIEDAGYDVIEAASADDAIRQLEKTDDVRLILTDVDMPGSMDGIRLASYVRRRWPPIQLVVISGKVGVTSGQLPAGARFVSKPYQESVLLNLVETMMAAGGSAV
jgi:CheY-like chemotaxis protein